MDSIKVEVKTELESGEVKQEVDLLKTDGLNEEKVSIKEDNTSSQSYPQDNNREGYSVHSLDEFSSHNLDGNFLDSNNFQNASKSSPLSRTVPKSISLPKSNKPLSLRRRQVRQKRQCPVCGKSVIELKIHMLTHTKEKRFKCLSCEECFSHRTALTRHTFQHSGKKPFTCGICNESFIEAYRLKMHLQLHTGVKAFECLICKKRFTREQHLKKHNRVHTQERPSTCNFCGKSFANKYTMRNHVNNVHKSVKGRIYKCSVCKKSFTCRKYLKKHIVIHEKPFKCAICNKEFSRKNYLVQHITKSHSEGNEETVQSRINTDLQFDAHINTSKNQEFKCFLCSRTFSSMYYLKQHVLSSY